MRTINTIKNMKIGMIFSIIILIFSFLVRGIFVKSFGANISGFNNIMISLIGFLNVAELGVSSAITYALYKPLKDNNMIKINEIMSLFKYIYVLVAKIILVLGLILAVFLNKFVKNQIPLSEAYLYYGLFLINSIISYFFIYKQTLIIADQKQYIVTIINNSIKLLKMCIQIGIAIILKSYIWWLLIEIISNIINLIITNGKIKILYPDLIIINQKNINKIIKKNTEILRDIKNLFFHKIAGFIVYQTDGILISIFLNLKQVAIYGNYFMLIGGVLSLINTIMSSFTASIGNLIAEQDEDKSFKIFRSMYVLDNFIGVIVVTVMYLFINEFIVLWVGKEYLFEQKIIILLMINMYMQLTRSSIDKFKECYGIFWDKIAPVIEGGVNFTVSYILVQKIGVAGLLIGTIISNILLLIIWKPYVLYKYGFNRKINEYIILLCECIIKSTIIFILSNIINKIIMNKITIEIYIIEFLLRGVIMTGITIITASIIFYSQKEFRFIIEKALALLPKKLKYIN